MGKQGGRGYALAAGYVGPAQAADPASLSPEMRVHQALAAIVSACIEQMIRNEPVIRRADNAEAVHKSRLRSALSLFREAWGGRRLAFEADLRWLQELLGAAREWDVFHETEIDPLAADQAPREAIQSMDMVADAARTNAYQALRRAFG